MAVAAELWAATRQARFDHVAGTASPELIEAAKDAAKESIDRVLAELKSHATHGCSVREQGAVRRESDEQKRERIRGEFARAREHADSLGPWRGEIVHPEPFPSGRGIVKFAVPHGISDDEIYIKVFSAALVADSKLDGVRLDPLQESPSLGSFTVNFNWIPAHNRA